MKSSWDILDARICSNALLASTSSTSARTPSLVALAPPAPGPASPIATSPSSSSPSPTLAPPFVFFFFPIVAAPSIFCCAPPTLSAAYVL